MRIIDGDDDSYDEIYYDKINNGRRKIWRNADGYKHRDGDHPAVIWEDGSVFYYKDGKLHRDDDLPAVICANGRVEYWINGVWKNDIN